MRDLSDLVAAHGNPSSTRPTAASMSSANAWISRSAWLPSLEDVRIFAERSQCLLARPPLIEKYGMPAGPPDPARVAEFDED